MALRTALAGTTLFVGQRFAKRRTQRCGMAHRMGRDAGPAKPQDLSSVELEELTAKGHTKLSALQEALTRVAGPWAEPWEVRNTEFQEIFFPRDCAPTYGELDQGYIARLLLQARLGPQDAIVDVGSGLGKLVIVAATMTDVGTAWGLELSPSRHKRSVELADELLAAGAISASTRHRIRLVQGDCGVDMPEELLGASHFLLTMKRSHRSVKALRNSLRASPSLSGRPRIIWSVAHNVPLCRGLTYQRCFPCEGYSNPPTQGPNSVSAGKLTKGFMIHEYVLESEPEMV